MVHAEWTKLRTLPANLWLSIAAVVLMVAASAAMAAPVTTEHCRSVSECFEDTVELSLSGVRFGQVAVVILAVLAIGNEYGSGMIQATLAANPQRLRLLLAKAIVLVSTVLVAGTAAVAGSLLAGRLILPANGFSVENGYSAISLADGPTLRAAFGTVLYLALIALLAFGVAVIVRDTAAAVTIVLGVLFLMPMIRAFISDPEWQERLEKLDPMTAGLAVQATIRIDQLPIGPWPGLGVLAAYAVAALLLGGLFFAVRRA